jgi:hypothetical protein
VSRRGGPTGLYESGLETVRPEGTSTVVANAVLAAGRRFPAFQRASSAERIGTDLEALVAWLRRSS